MPSLKGAGSRKKLSADCLPRRKTRMRPGIRRLEAEYDILPADAHLHKFVHHFALRIVDLEPDFSVFDIKVEYDGKDILIALPADAQQLKAVVFPVGNFFGFDIRQVGGARVLSVIFKILNDQ